MMTPEYAAHVLQDAREGDTHPISDGEAALATIAAMTEEWGVEVETSAGWCRWLNLDGGDPRYATREHAEHAARYEPNPTRVVRRYVVETEVIE